MSRYIKLFKKWIKMYTGNSVFHVYQRQGRYYSKESIKGYYSDLRHKVRGNTLLDDLGLPINKTNLGKKIYFPITIFQYGLGAYDLYIETKKKHYIEKLLVCAEWAIENQEYSGAWDTFSWCTEAKYSSMAQGEGASLLVRAYIETSKDKYIEAAIKAIDFMLVDTKVGGTTVYIDDNKITFKERLDKGVILNGIIFSLWGLYDIRMVRPSVYYDRNIEMAINYLVESIKDFDTGYWTYYDEDGTIASPFYHNLHIEQMEVIGDLFFNKTFKEISEKWFKYENSRIKKTIAVIYKIFQKLKGMNNEITLVE